MSSPAPWAPDGAGQVADGGSALPDPIDPNDPNEAIFVADCPEALRPFNRAGILHPADVHVATTLARLSSQPTSAVALLATALAVRATRLGHVCANLATLHVGLFTEDGGGPGNDHGPHDGHGPGGPVPGRDALPTPDAFMAELQASSLVRAPSSDTMAPLVLDGDRLYLDRYWHYEQQAIADLRRRVDAGVLDIDAAALDDAIGRVFGSSEPPGIQATDDVDLQRLAARVAVTSHVSVIAGGPGTGKTTTVARVLAILLQLAHANGTPLPRIALAAPTGKAAARMNQSLREALPDLPVDPEVVTALQSIEAGTIHRLLRTRRDSATRFRHGANHPLPHDVVVVDETSMVSLALLTKLLMAVRPEARVLLVGDPDQLFSVEAGAVLGDIVGPMGDGSRKTTLYGARRPAITTSSMPAASVAQAPLLGERIVVLRAGHRFGRGSGIAALADGIRDGDADGVVRLLQSAPDDLTWVRVDVDDGDAIDGCVPLREAVTDAGRAVFDAAAKGDAEGALEAAAQVQILCSHRRGPAGVSGWTTRVERWLADTMEAYDPRERWFVGRPVIVTSNDYQLGLFNGDTGVVLASTRGPQVAFDTADGIRLIPTSRLDAIDTAYALTIHKSQGSQFGHVVAVLPARDSPILTRELLYTAVTRAKRHVSLVAREEIVRTAVERQVQRASGLRAALWGAG